MSACECRGCRQWPERSCADCHGRGWYPEVVAGTEDDYIPDFVEKYCDCSTGRRKMGLGI